MVENVEFKGHATFKIKGSKVIYTDPYQIGTEEPADIILVTHSHFDHCSPEDIRKLVTENTKIICSKDCVGKLRDLGGEVKGVEPGNIIDVDGVKIEVVPAYNINKTFHPKSSRWNGYVFTLDGVTYYHPGDTDKIPEMSDIKANVVFLPVGGTYTMDWKEAAEAAKLINPDVVIPMHYGAVVGSEKDAEEFAHLVGSKARILPVS
ncbi:MAG: MBL fold metallo-hydrolase [Spirochaetes bacterium]|nr:MAG: MBL fold metallo-hydrolase [Spirochaetota bacterium]